MIQNFSEIEEKVDGVIKEYDYYSIYARDGRDVAQEVRRETADRLDKNITNNKNGIKFTKRHEEYVKYRKMDMHLDNEKIEQNNDNSPTICELNFNCATIGSDETGTGEIFKPIVVVAVYLENEEQVDKCIRMGITDSKKYESNPERIFHIAETITGLKRNDWKTIKNKKLITSDFFAIRIIPNDELNKKCEELNKSGKIVAIDGAKEILLKQAHAEVVGALYEKHPGSSVVIDDFTEEIKRKQNNNDDLNFRTILDKELHGANVYLTTKGDSKVISVALASMISYYVSDLGLEDARNEFIKLCNDERCKFPAGADLNVTLKKNEDKVKFLECAEKVIKEDFRAYMNKYAKKYYKNVISLMKKYE